MEIVGIGTDIVEVKRFEDNTEKFIKRYFSNDEISYFKSKKNNIQTISGNFAAKEAIVKALGTGFRNINVRDIEVLRDELGKPIVRFSNDILQEYEIMVSISHTNDVALASAIAIRR